MKFLCLAYLDRGLAPPPGVASEYGALDWAARIPAAAYGSIEVRPPR